MRAYTYLRVSSKGQVEGDGPERQRLACVGFTQPYNIEIIQEFFDAYSGSGSAEERPEFGVMLASIDARNANPNEARVDCVIVERMDRLARDLMASEFLLRELRNRGVKLFAADQGQLIDMASNDIDPTRILIRQFMAALAQWEKSTLVKKLRVARERAEKEGVYSGRKPYGALTGEQEGLRQLHEWSRQGYSTTEVADMMNARGYPSRTGVPWTRHTVGGILARVGQIVSASTGAKAVRKEIANLLPKCDS